MPATRRKPPAATSVESSVGSSVGSTVATTGREPTFTISELAREFALTPRAIRFYEDEGLLSPGRRGSVRVYAERERVRLKLILRGKRLGFSLQEIRELLDLYAIGRNERAQLAKFLAMLDQRRARLLQQREDIDAVLAEIEGVERECRTRLLAEAAASKSRATGEHGSAPVRSAGGGRRISS